MIGTVFTKPVDDWGAYADAAEWCNQNNAYIVEYEDKYVVESLPEQSLQDMKSAKLNELDNSFNKRVSGSITTTNGYLMQFDVSDSLKMQGALTLMESIGSTTGYITQANDETVYNIPIDVMKTVLIEMLNAYAQCHARKQELRTFINNAQSKEELDEIVISWPV